LLSGGDNVKAEEIYATCYGYLNEACLLLEINTPKLVGTILPENKRSVFSFDKVGIDFEKYKNVMSIDMRKDMYHEARHTWQFTVKTTDEKEYLHRQTLLWWCQECHRKAYQKYYYSEICSIEYDARVFGNTLGLRAREDLLLKYSVEALEKLTL
jgi:hypothetical protein